ncbi:MAG: type II toxin-antitoxin system VapC family toxin [Cyanobacteriota bacterium]|nr:type II toxin-antitoxin system VapC family toxin [Cyanobacteriota bacterium]
MNLLLDTHTFLWFVNDDSRLSQFHKNLIENESNDSYLSLASLWEMSIKYNLGKLRLEPSYEDFVKKEVNGSNVILLAIKLEHIKANASLPFYHRDPFDRIIIAQSMTENIPIITLDVVFKQYSVELIDG